MIASAYIVVYYGVQGTPVVPLTGYVAPIWRVTLYACIHYRSSERLERMIIGRDQMPDSQIVAAVSLSPCITGLVVSICRVTKWKKFVEKTDPHLTLINYFDCLISIDLT